MKKKQKKVLIRIIISAVLLIALNILSAAGVLADIFLLKLGLFLIPYLIIGYDILIKAGRGIINLRPFDECFLMSVATIGAFVIAIVEKTGDYNEAVAVMLFYQIGEWFQSYAVGKSRRNITELMDIRPDHANIEQDGNIVSVDPGEIQPGSIIIVNPGEKVPIDGVVEEGESSLDTSALTGESLPRTARAGDEIISGCINMTGVLKIRTVREFGESTVSRILELVENASSRKSRSENFISRFARIYTPAVCGCALALAVLPPLFNILILHAPGGWNEWVYRALTFLVISCPCALVISIPLSFFAGIGGASHEGILVKGSNYLEALSKVDTVVFDKTGTLTKGVFSVNAVHHNNMSRDELLALAVACESASSHPIAVSIRHAFDGQVPSAADIREISGQGVTALVNGRRVAVGNEKLMRAEGAECVPCHEAGTIIHIAVDGRYEGHFVISDVVKENAKAAIDSLRSSGIKKCIMLTGDSAAAAEPVASALGLDETYAGLLPADKVERVEGLIAAQSGSGKLAFAGDGINDAPVLSRADVGIAMGALGSDAAIEAADVVLMDDDPLKIARAIRIARKALRIVYENIWFAIGVKFICLVLGALGITNMWLAIFADVGVMVIAILNAIRALRVRNL